MHPSSSLYTTGPKYPSGHPATEDRVGPIGVVVSDPTSDPGSRVPVSKAFRNTHSYFSDRHSRSMKTLSIQMPRPSIEIRMSASFKVLVKAKLGNCRNFCV